MWGEGLRLAVAGTLWALFFSRFLVTAFQRVLSDSRAREILPACLCWKQINATPSATLQTAQAGSSPPTYNPRPFTLHREAARRAKPFKTIKKKKKKQQKKTNYQLQVPQNMSVFSNYGDAGVRVSRPQLRPACENV